MRSTFTPQVLGDVGFFGALYHLKGFRDPVLVAGTDNVGTKLKIAALADAWEGVGQDVADLSPAGNDGFRGANTGPDSADPTWEAEEGA
ncbi:MAG: hypothetical protein IIB55_03470 [Planctomycetes bacterium]|nr:hypothetical protein [Planctomycetota bacterium]